MRTLSFSAVLSMADISDCCMKVTSDCAGDSDCMTLFRVSRR